MFIPTHFLSSLEFQREPTELDFLLDPEIEQVEKIFNQFCEGIKKPGPQDYSRPLENSSIPPLIHFIWLGSTLPPKAQAHINSWRHYHPGWTVKIWTDRDLEGFPWSSKRSYTLFKKAESFPGKGDILRLEILYAYGGIYSDVDVICLKAFHDVCGMDFFGGLELNRIWKGYGKALYVGNAIMGAKKGCRLIKGCIDQLAPAETELDIILKSGPGLISRVCSQMLVEPDGEKILILPCSYLYPLPYHGRFIEENSYERYVSPESLAIHLWDQSWKK